MQPREEVGGGFFLAEGDASELFDKIEEAFNEVVFGIEGEIAVARDHARRGRSTPVAERLDFLR